MSKTVFVIVNKDGKFKPKVMSYGFQNEMDIRGIVHIFKTRYMAQDYIKYVKRNSIINDKLYLKKVIINFVIS